MKFKHIMVEVDEPELPLIFSTLPSDEDVTIGGTKHVKSAGYCRSAITGKRIVGGRSVSLELHAGRQDEVILNEPPAASDD